MHSQLSAAIATLLIMAGIFWTVWSTYRPSDSEQSPPRPVNPPSYARPHKARPLNLPLLHTPPQWQLPDLSREICPSFMQPVSMPVAWVIAAREERELREAWEGWWWPGNAGKLFWWWLWGINRGERGLMDKVEMGQWIGECCCLVSGLREEVSGDVLRQALVGLNGLVLKNLGTIASNLRNVSEKDSCHKEELFAAAVGEFNLIMTKLMRCPDCVLPERFIPSADIQTLNGSAFKMLLFLSGCTEPYHPSARNNLQCGLLDLTKALMPVIIFRMTRLSFQHLDLISPVQRDINQLTLNGTVSSRLVANGFLSEIYQVGKHISETRPGNSNNKTYHEQISMELRAMVNAHIKRITRVEGYTILRPANLAIQAFNPSHAVPLIIHDYLL